MNKSILVSIPLGFALGIFWFTWSKFGFWWGVLYGLGWLVWCGYRFAEWTLQ